MSCVPADQRLKAFADRARRRPDAPLAGLEGIALQPFLNLLAEVGDHVDGPRLEG